jgi:hypothetical protein
MKIISHRGNLKGKNPERENSPSYIDEAIFCGYDVEVDVWLIDKKYYLGHDAPQYEVTADWLLKRPLWCHAKNIDAMEKMMDDGIHYFWHENDRFTLTSKGIPWCYPNNYNKNGIVVVLDNSFPSNLVSGICTDYPLTVKKNAGL